MAPTRIYAKSVLALMSEVEVRGMAHITGGGILENLPRMFDSTTLAARLDLDAWQRPEVFSWLQQAGNVPEREMLRTFNCGIGYVLCLSAPAAQQALQRLTELGEHATVIGEMVAATAGGEPVVVAA